MEKKMLCISYESLCVKRFLTDLLIQIYSKTRANHKLALDPQTPDLLRNWFLTIDTFAAVAV
jgi:hypothetical protein